MKLVRRRIGGRKGSRRKGRVQVGGGRGRRREKKGRCARLGRLLGCTERDGGGVEKDRMKGTSGKIIHISPET